MQAAARAYGRTLYRSDGYGYRVREIIEAYEEAAPVDVERERLLDLLDKLWNEMPLYTTVDPQPLRGEVEALLREYGRLGKEES